MSPSLKKTLDAAKDPPIEIGNLMIKPVYARQGIISRCVEMVMQPTNHYVALVLKHNTKSCDLFKKMGFQIFELPDLFVFYFPKLEDNNVTT